MFGASPRELLRCSPQENADVYHAAISGFGMLGCFVELELQLKRVHSGRLAVRAIVAASTQRLRASASDPRLSALATPARGFDLARWPGVKAWIKRGLALPGMVPIDRAG